MQFCLPNYEGMIPWELAGASILTKSSHSWLHKAALCCRKDTARLHLLHHLHWHAGAPRHLDRRMLGKSVGESHCPFDSNQDRAVWNIPGLGGSCNKMFQLLVRSRDLPVQDLLQVLILSLHFWFYELLPDEC